MKRKRNAGGLLCVCSLLGGIPVYADVGIDNQVITTGTEIKVLEPGPDLQAIIDGITDEGPDKPYLISLGPGEFIITANPSGGFGLVMAPYISIVGSGQDVTILRGAISSGSEDSSSAVVTGASNAVLRDLSVDNTGGNEFSIAILNDAASTRIERVTAEVSVIDDTNKYGIYNLNSSPTIIEVTARATGENGSNFGVYNVSSSPTMTEVVAIASGSTNYGVYNFLSSSPTMTEVVAKASFGSSNYGVFNVFSSPKMFDVVVLAAEGGTDNFGIYNDDSTSSPQVWGSALGGSTNAMQFNGSTGTQIINTEMQGGIDADPVGDQCRNTFDENLVTVSC